MRKKVDERIRSLIESGVKARHRSMFVLIGDKSRDQIVNLYYMLSKVVTGPRPTVLWCYKNNLDLSSHKKKRAKQVKKLLQRGLLDPEKANSFSLFLESGVITHCFYDHPESILGNTYNMCILQDFEALKPNFLASTVETVQGGGLVILLLRSLSSLSSLCTMVMDIHKRFRTESHSEKVPRFNERFLLSLASCKACLVLDDELNILPISSHVKSVARSSGSEGSNSREDLKRLKETGDDDSLAGPLLGICRTVDQENVIRTFLKSFLTKERKTIALTSARGRGKSAALGLAIAGAIAAGYPRICVAAPSPENLKSLFEFVRRGLSALTYEEHLHYNLVNETVDPKIRKPITHQIPNTITQINVYKEHPQIVQYIKPRDHLKLCQAALLVIDEAAAIPLPVVKALLQEPNLVFISSTVNGYEGTGRSLSLKLFDHLQKQSQDRSGNLFKKIELNEPIRYASGDPIECWLNGLLCLDAMNSVSTITRPPHPSECNLYYVNRETLFSFHKESEVFLERMMGLFISSHYKNSPNDLQLMADAPAHHLFVLLGPVDETSNVLPDILCAVQVCFEGAISRKSSQKSLQAGRLPSGDQIPWKICEEFENADFPTLSGVQVVRIAVHPSVQRHGYGSAALDLLTRYYEGKLTAIGEMDEENVTTEFRESISEAANEVSLLEETISPKKDLPPLLVHLRDRAPESVDYIGASFGLQKDLFHFWWKQRFTPLFICDYPNDTTGEHSCIVLKPLETHNSSLDYLAPLYQSFKRKFVKQLTRHLQDLDCNLAMSILEPRLDFSENNTSSSSEMEPAALVKLICGHDELKLLESISYNRKDVSKGDNLLPFLAYYFFEEKIPVKISYIQASILLCMGLQRHDVSYVKQKVNIEREQVRHYIRKMMVKFHKYFDGVLNKSSSPQEREVKPLLKPCAVSVDEDLKDGAQKVMEKMRREEGILQEYSIEYREGELKEALEKCGKVSGSGVLSVKSCRNAHKRKRNT